MKKEIMPVYLKDREFAPNGTQNDSLSLKRRKLKYKWATNYIHNGDIVLDAGCASGFGSNLLADDTTARIIGIDCNSELIHYAGQHYRKSNLSFQVMDCTAMGFRDGIFDVICSFEVIEHILKVEDYLVEIRRVLKTNGLFILSTDNRLFRDFKSQDICEFHVKEYYPNELRRVLETYFDVVNIFGMRDIHNIIGERMSCHSGINFLLKLKMGKIVPRKIKNIATKILTGYVLPSNNTSIDELASMVEISPNNISNSPTLLSICKEHSE